MTQPDREHHLAKKVRIQSVEVSLRVLASDSGLGPYVTDVVNLGELRTTIAIPNIDDLAASETMLALAFRSAIEMAKDSVVLFDQRNERFAAELSVLTERMAAEKAAREAKATAEDVPTERD